MDPLDDLDQLSNWFKVVVGTQNNRKEFEVIVEIVEDQEGEKKRTCRMGYINNLMQMFDRNDCSIETIQPETFQWIVSYMDQHKWNPPMPKTPLKSGILQENISEIDYELLKDYNIKDENTNNPLHLKNIHAAADFLQIPELRALIAVKIATEFYFGNDLRSYEDLKIKHEIDKDLTIQEEIRIQNWYPNQINKQYSSNQN